uniref:Uncharacterized protein n=1 Tax=Glossina austeni TaxID=7395 RepID=A0A1A9VD78_GLOAU
MARQEQQIREQEQLKNFLTSNSSTHIPNAPTAKQDLQQQQQVRKRPSNTNPLNAEQLSDLSDQVTQRQRIQNRYVSQNIGILFNNPMFRSLQRLNVKLYGLQRSPQTKRISQNNEMFPATQDLNLTPSSTQRLSQNNSLLPNSQMFPAAQHSLAVQLFPQMKGFSSYSPVLSATNDFKFNLPATQQFALNKHISENNQMLPATHSFQLVPAVTRLFPHNNKFPPNAQVPSAIQSPNLSPTVKEIFSQNNDFLSKADVQRTIPNMNFNSSANQQFALYKSTLESSQKVQKNMRKKFPYDAVVAQMLANQQQSEFQPINANISEIRTYPAQRTNPLWLDDNQVKFSSNNSPSHVLIDPNYINHPQRVHYYTAYMLKQKIEYKNSSQMLQFIPQMLDNSLEKEVSATGVMTPNNQSLVDNFENNLTANRENVSNIRPTNISVSDTSERAAVRGSLLNCSNKSKPKEDISLDFFTRVL